MKLSIGATTKDLPMKTTTHFASAMNSPLLEPRVVSVTDAHEHTDLLKTLNATPRPYAVCVLTVK